MFDEFESLSPAQRQHAKTYATGFVAASNKTVAGIEREVLPAQGKRALNKFLTEYNWDEQQFNHERLEELQKHGETRWSKDGYIILDDTITEKAGDEVPASAGSTITPKMTLSGGKTLSTPSTLTTRPPIRSPSASTNNKTMRTTTKYDLAREIVTELEEEVGVPADTYLFDSWFPHDSSLPDHIESYCKDWVGPLRSNRKVTYAGEGTSHMH